jgi:peroxiredoxin Q/BCP
MRGFQAVHSELEALGARVVGVSADSFAANGAFAEKNDIEFPLLSDWPDNKTMEAFGVLAEGRPVANRTTFVFDQDGVVRAMIDDAREMEAHPSGALEAVKELVAGD